MGYFEIAILYNGSKKACAYFLCETNFTQEALRLTISAVEASKKITDSDEIYRAINIFKSIGAGFDDSELERLNREWNIYRNYWLPYCQDKNRNGHICITTTGMGLVDYWCGSNVVNIDISKGLVEFNVVDSLSIAEHKKMFGRKQNQSLHEEALTNLIDISAIPFSHLKSLRKVVMNNPSGVIVDDGLSKYILSWR